MAISAGCAPEAWRWHRLEQLAVVTTGAFDLEYLLTKVGETLGSYWPRKPSRVQLVGVHVAALV